METCFSDVSGIFRNMPAQCSWQEVGPITVTVQVWTLQQSAFSLKRIVSYLLIHWECQQLEFHGYRSRRGSDMQLWYYHPCEWQPAFQLHRLPTLNNAKCQYALERKGCFDQYYLNAKYKNVIAIFTGEANLATVISRAHLNPNRQEAEQLTI